MFAQPNPVTASTCNHDCDRSDYKILCQFFIIPNLAVFDFQLRSGLCFVFGLLRVWFASIELKIRGERDDIGVTPQHPIWSEDRGDWISAGELQTGERVKTLDGTTIVESLSLRNQPEPVYNIEVEGDHVYRVGESGALVHNTSQQIFYDSCDEAHQLAGLPPCNDIMNPKSGDPDTACQECNPNCHQCASWGGRNVQSRNRKSFFLNSKPDDQKHYMCSPRGQRNSQVHYNSVVCGFCCEERCEDGNLEVWKVQKCVCQQ